MLSQQAACVRASPMPKSQKIRGRCGVTGEPEPGAAPGATGLHADQITRRTQTAA